MLLSLVVFLGAGGGVVSLSLDYWPGNPDFWVNLLAEAQEGRVDPLLFGCLLLWFDRQAERHRQVKRYRNAISDVLGGEEATSRIAGNTRRLNRTGAAPDTLEGATWPRQT